MSGDTIPGWLRNDWAQFVRGPLLEQGVSDEALVAVFQTMLARWRARPQQLTERTIAKYVGFTREWLRTLALEPAYLEQVLRCFSLPTETYAQLNDLSRGKVDWRNEHQLLLPDPLAIMHRLIELLDHADWAPLAVALAGLTGRRIGEVLLTGSVQQKSAYSVLFTGRLKRRGAAEKEIEIPTACEAQRIVDGWDRLRQHPGLRAASPYLCEEIPPEKVNQVLRQLNRDLSPPVRKAADYYFHELIPMLEEDEGDQEVGRWGLYTHLFRSVYVTLAIWLYCPVRVHPDAFAAAVLGHSYYAATQEGEERLNYASGQHYHRYGIADGRGNHDGRRGIRLSDPNYPGVQVIEQFQEDAMQPQAAINKQGKKRRKRQSKTGFSSIRPRTETRDWFDQVAEAEGIAWKPTDATLRLLLETYEAHQRCQQAGGGVPAQITPQQLGVSGELCARIATAMQACGQESFLAFLEQALVRESNTQIGLAESRKKREAEDVAGLPWSAIKGSRRPEASYERIRRAIGTILDYNRQCQDPNGYWYINVNLLRDYIGASPTFITPVLKANQELLARHHEHFKITRSHNQTPAHKATPISRDPALAIPEEPTAIKSLSEVVVPSPSVEEAAHP